MADSDPGPSPDADASPAGSSEAPDWGRLLDAAGIIAGVFLVVIIADILSDGRLISKRLHRQEEDDVDRSAD
jgi:hypothetical protein